MKAKLQLTNHLVHRNETVVEVKLAGEMIAAIYQGENGIRILSEHELTVTGTGKEIIITKKD